MKRTGLLNRHLGQLVASLGHLDEITVCDAGLPMPKGVEVIDLAILPGVPDFWSVLSGLRSELMIESAVIAEEASPDLEARIRGELAIWGTEQGRKIEEVAKLSHVDFKRRTCLSKAVIRSGEVTPYCNIILVSGVAF